MTIEVYGGEPMTEAHILREQEMALAEALRTLWERAHGATAGKVRVLAGPDSVAAWLEEVLSPAEQAAAGRAESQALLQRYAEQLLSTVQPDLRERVESVTGRRIVSSAVRADVDTGHVLCFFVLGERRPDETSETGGEPGKDA
jgi:uncharacterized protein YbcI